MAEERSRWVPGEIGTGNRCGLQLLSVQGMLEISSVFPPRSPQQGGVPVELCGVKLADVGGGLVLQQGTHQQTQSGDADENGEDVKLGNTGDGIF